MKADIVTYAINALRTIHFRQESYCELNQQIKVLQGDFASSIQCVDGAVLDFVVIMLDEILCGHASYWLYECSQNGSVTHEDGTEYPLVTIADIEAYARQFSPYANKQSTF